MIVISDCSPENQQRNDEPASGSQRLVISQIKKSNVSFSASPKKCGYVTMAALGFDEKNQIS